MRGDEWCYMKCRSRKARRELSCSFYHEIVRFMSKKLCLVQKKIMSIIWCYNLTMKRQQVIMNRKAWVRMKKRMKKGFYGCIITLVMVFCLVPVTTKQAFASPSLLTVEDNPSNNSQVNIFANGNAIILEAVSNTDYTNIYYDSNRDGEIDEGSGPLNLNDYLTSTRLKGDITTGFDFSNISVYGGSKNKSVDGDIQITMLSGYVNGIHGGGYSYESASPANVNGSTNIDISGGYVDVIQGGGYGNYATITGNTNIKLTNQKIRMVWGGGAYGANVLGNSNILIEGPRTEDFTGAIHGGGLKGTVKASYITINAPSYINSNIFVGGGYGGTILTNTNITVNGGTVYRIYGGGYGPGVSTVVNEAANITVNAGSVSEMYLGGFDANDQVGSASVTMMGGYINSIYKGSVSGSVQLTCTGGTIGGTVDAELLELVATLTDITLTPTIVSDDAIAVAGTKVADLAVAGTPTTGITYTLDGLSYDNSKFQIVGSELQIKSGMTLAARGYTVKVKVSENANLFNTFTKTLHFTPTIGEIIPPIVSSITRLVPLEASTNLSSVTYRVIFSESVTGVDTNDFTLITTGNATGSIASVSSISGTTIDVTVNTITGEGTIRLDLQASGTGITDTAGNAIEGGYTGGEAYTVDRIAPTLAAGPVTRTSDTNAIVKFTSDKAGKYYYIVVASGAVQPVIDTSGAGINCSAAENTISLVALSAGAKDIYVVVKDALDNISVDTFKISIPEYVTPPSDGGNGGGNSGDGNSGGGNSSGGSNDSGAADSKADSDHVVEIRINDIAVNAGTKVETEVEGKTFTTVSLDEKLMDERITAKGKNAIITIPINNTSSDALVAEFNGQTVKSMSEAEAIIEIKTDVATYTLPALQIDIENIAKQLGQDLELSDIKVKVEIAKISAETKVMVENAANTDNFTVIADPVEFRVSCTYGNEIVDVSKFNNYVQRMVVIPIGTDAARITTGVVINADGTVRHVPTKFEVIDGRYYVRISSLTNSTYAVIWNPITYKDVKKSSAKAAINDLGSRMVISGAKNGLFRPDQDITRAEFVAMLVTSLGLEPGTEDTLYKDVKLKDWYSKYIEAANEYGIISGSAKAKFRPKDKITTEEAATMLANAMKITELNVKFKKGEAKKLLTSLAKSGKTQKWTDNSMATCMKAGIITVKSNQKIAPKDKLTRAEAAVIIRKLLVKSNLI